MGGDIIKDIVASFFSWVFKRLHREKVVPSIKIEATQSHVIIINIHKD